MDMTNERKVSEAIKYRRSIRVFKKENLNTEKVKECIYLASLAPTSSNMQLWEFYHICSPEVLAQITEASFYQNAAKTANQMVVVVARKDLWKKRIVSNTNFLKESFGNKPESGYSKREKGALKYYQKTVYALYFDFIGIIGLFKYLYFHILGLFKPTYKESRRSDMRIVAQKSAALAAQNFMISMAAINYDTCPMEGFDSKRIKKILNINSGSEINMIVACGIREENGVYGEQFRLPMDEIYFKL